MEPEEYAVHLLYIRQAVDRVNNRLDALNGQTRDNAEDIAVLRDRSERTKSDGAKHGGVWGAVGGMLAGFAAGWIK